MLIEVLILAIILIKQSTGNLININAKVNVDVSENPLDYSPTHETNGPILYGRNVTDLLEYKGIAIIETTVTVLDENDVSNSVDLRELSLINTGLEEMHPGCFKNLSELKYLILEDNHLKRIPNGVFANLPLTFLSLRVNELDTIENEAFKNITHLINLDLAENKLAKLAPDWFVDLANLEELDLSQNELEILPNSIFAPLQKLELLYINDNKIKCLQDDSLSGLSNLNLLNLDDNAVTSVNERVFAGPGHNLRELYLCRNPLECKTGKVLQTLLYNLDILAVDEKETCEDRVYPKLKLFVSNRKKWRYFRSRKRVGLIIGKRTSVSRLSCF